jgi:hypothetical protein
MTVSVASLQYGLKTLWPQSRIKDEVYPDHPFLAMIPKREDFYGDSAYIALQTGDPQGRSASFANAQAISALTGAGNAGSSRGARFLLTRAKDYQIINLETEVILASQNDEGALIRALDTEMRSGMRNIGKSLAVSLFRGQTGQVGTVGSFTGTTVTLSNINDVTSFELGMQLVFAANTTSALRVSTGIAITGVNRDSGVLTFASTASVTGLANNDVIFSLGDYVSASDRLKVSGLADWIPSTTPSATAFFGVDRSVDPTRLAGLRIDASALSPEEGLVLALSRQAREGGKQSHILCNHADYRNIQISLGSKVETEYQTVGNIGFQSIQMHGPKGVVSIMADQDCPAGIAYSLDMSTWKLFSLKGCPMILDMDGNQLSRVAAADQFEARIVYFAQLYTDAPGWNGVITMPT